MIGAKTTFITWFFLVVTWVIAYPISVILDRLLGGEVGTVYEKEHLLEMVRAEASAKLDQDERDIMTGALTYADKTVKKVMTPIHDIFSLRMDEVLDIGTIRRVIDSGHSRIPVVVQQGDYRPPELRHRCAHTKHQHAQLVTAHNNSARTHNGCLLQ